MTPTRSDVLRWAADQLRAVPVDSTALTGPMWYGAGWEDAADHLEGLADSRAFETERVCGCEGST